jgi:hypothetical protein
MQTDPNKNATDTSAFKVKFVSVTRALLSNNIVEKFDKNQPFVRFETVTNNIVEKFDKK